MRFYAYFRIAKEFCPKKLKPFAPSIYYEVARQLERYAPYYTGNFYVTREMLEPVYRTAYDKIVERMGYQAWLESHMQR